MLSAYNSYLSLYATSLPLMPWTSTCKTFCLGQDTKSQWNLQFCFQYTKAFFHIHSIFIMQADFTVGSLHLSQSAFLKLRMLYFLSPLPFVTQLVITYSRVITYSQAFKGIFCNHPKALLFTDSVTVWWRKSFATTVACIPQTMNGEFEISLISSLCPNSTSSLIIWSFLATSRTSMQGSVMISQPFLLNMLCVYYLFQKKVGTKFWAVLFPMFYLQNIASLTWNVTTHRIIE